MEKDRIQGVAFLPEEPGFDRNARFPELRGALAANLGVWVKGAVYHAGQPCREDCFGTGRRAPMVAARL